MGFPGHKYCKVLCCGMFFLHFALAPHGFGQNLSTGQTAAQTADPKRRDLDEIKKKGLEYLRAGDWESANSAFENALAISPSDGVSLYGKALALFNLKRIGEADKNLEVLFRVVASAGDNDQLLTDSLVLSAIISAVEKNSAAAIEKLEKAANLVPAHFDA